MFKFAMSARYYSLHPKDDSNISCNIFHTCLSAADLRKLQASRACYTPAEHSSITMGCMHQEATDFNWSYRGCAVHTGVACRAILCPAL